MKLVYKIQGKDMTLAGEASSDVKLRLKQLGFDPSVIKKTAVSMYEAEMNAVIHADGGSAEVTIYEDGIKINITDKGPGITNIDLAMKEGYSTAPDSIRQMGFGAGMGLPNIKRNTSRMDIRTVLGVGTTLVMEIDVEDDTNE